MTIHSSKSGRILAASLVALVLCATGAFAFWDRNALWRTVQSCKVDLKTLGLAFPCLHVASDPDKSESTVVIRAPLEQTHIIVVPTHRVPGLESPVLLRPESGAYWRAAWDARHYVASAHPRPLRLADIGIAANSQETRSQDQFHIHADCVSSRVRADLSAHAGGIGPAWKLLPFTVAGHRYYGRQIAAAQLAAFNPLGSLVDAIPALRERMDVTGFAILPAQSPDAQLTLLANASPQVAMEDVLDHACRGV